MKTINRTIVLLSLIALTCTQGIAAGIEVSGSITIGKGDNCKGLGICKANSNNKSLTDGAVESSFVYNAKTNTLIIKIAQKDLIKRAADKDKHFRNQKFFVMEDNFTIPQDLQKAFKSKHRLQIKKGEYPMVYEKGIYCITIKL